MEGHRNVVTFKVDINRERINVYESKQKRVRLGKRRSTKRHEECCLGNGPSETAAMLLLLCSLGALAPLGALLVIGAVTAVLVIVLVPLALVLVVLLPLLSILGEIRYNV